MGALYRPYHSVLPIANATGPIVASGINSPLDLGFYTYYDLASGVTLNGSDIAQVNNLVLPGTRDLAQADPTMQPSFNASDALFNGQPSGTWDGVDEYLTTTGYVLPNPATFFAIARLTKTSSSCIFSRSSGGGRMGASGGGTTLLGNAAPDLAAATTYPLTACIFAIWNGASSSITINGVTTSGNAGGSIGSDGFNLGELLPGSVSQPFGGRFAACGWLARAISASDMAALRAYSLIRWGVS